MSYHDIAGTSKDKKHLRLIDCVPGPNYSKMFNTIQQLCHIKEINHRINILADYWILYQSLNGLYHILPKSNGYDCLLTATDRFARMIHLLRTETTKEIARLFTRHIVRLHDIPQNIISDRDSKLGLGSTQCSYIQLPVISRDYYQTNSKNSFNSVHRPSPSPPAGKPRTPDGFTPSQVTTPKYGLGTCKHIRS